MLSVVMLSLLVASAMPVFAEGETPFSIENKEGAYATLEAATDAAVSGDTILLNANYTTSTDVNITVDKALTIKSAEAGQFKITITADPSPKARWITATADLTIENVNIVTTQGIAVTGGNFLLKNLTVTMEYTYKASENTPGSFAFLSVGNANATLDNVNMTYHLETGNGNYQVGSQVIHLYGTTTFEMKQNSSITVTSDSTNSANGNFIMIIDYGDTATSTIGSTVSVNIGDGCKLSNKITQTGDYGIRNKGIFFSRGSNTPSAITLNLANGSILECITDIVTYDKYTPGWVSGNGTYATKYTINDSGCTYIVNSPVKKSNSGSIKNGCLMYFPTVANAADSDCFYTADGTTVANGGTYELTAGTTYEFKFGTYVALEDAFKVGENTYETLSEAITAANADDTIYVQRDVSVSETNLTVDKNLTIKSTDGEKFTITVVAAQTQNARWIKSSANLTIENVTIDTAQGIEATVGTLTLKNVTATMTGTSAATYTSKEYGDYAFIAANNATVILDASEITHNVNANGNAIYLAGTDTTFTMTNGSTVTAKGETSITAVRRQFTVFANGGNSDGTIKINIGDGCRLVNQMNGSSLRPTGLIMLHNLDSTTEERFNITLENGSELYLNTKIVSNNSPLYPGFISNSLTLEENYGQVITDNGCTYIAKHIAADNAGTVVDSGITYFPYVSANETNADYKFVNADGETVDNGGSYQCTAGEEVSFKFQSPAKPLLTNTVGASIRTDEPYGIRFRGEVNKDVYNALIADETVKSVTFGMMVLNRLADFEELMYDGEAGVDYFNAEYRFDELTSDGTYTMAIYFTDDTLLANSGKDLFTAKMYACAYYVVEYENGTDDVVFADFNETDNARSIYDVAKAYKTLPTYTETAFVENIISVCETA